MALLRRYNINRDNPSLLPEDIWKRLRLLVPIRGDKSNVNCRNRLILNSSSKGVPLAI